MWLEAMYASMSIAGLCGVTVGVNALFPNEVKRFGRFVRAEIGSRIGIKPKRPSIELALHADLEVDMKWWDEEFAKLKREMPTSGWSLMVQDEISKMNNALAGEIARIEAAKRQKAAMVGLNVGNVMYHFQPFSNSEHVEPKKTDATPPGLPYSLREAKKAGVTLEKAIDRAFDAFREDPRTSLIPRDISAKIKYRLGGSCSWGELISATQWGNLMLEKHGTPREEECEFCEYVEMQTYASPYNRRYKTAECWGCEQEKLDREKPMALYSPIADAKWSIS